MEKPAFPTRDAPIGKRNLFLLSGRAVSSCRHKIMEKPAFPTRDAPIGKRNLFLLSGRAVSRCRHKILQESGRDSNYLQKQTFKS